MELNLRGPALAALRAEHAALQGSRLSRASVAAPNASLSARNPDAGSDTLDAFADLPAEPYLGKDTTEEAARPRASPGSAPEGWCGDECRPDQAEPSAGRLRKLKRLRRAGDDAALPAECTSGMQEQAATSAAEGAPRGINASRRAPADWSEENSDSGGRHRNGAYLVRPSDIPPI